MNRADFQALALMRVADAASLLKDGRWSAAYYFIGYAVEFALKACIAKRTNQYDFPDKERANKSHTHRIEELVVQADLLIDRKADSAANPIRRLYWQTVEAWNESSRYLTCSEQNARNLNDAINDPVHGVMTWIMARW